MSPIVHGLENAYMDTIHFIYLDVDNPDNAELLSLLGYRYHPHFFFLDGEGNIIQEWIGPVAETDLRTAFDAQIP